MQCCFTEIKYIHILIIIEGVDGGEIKTVCLMI